MAHMLEYDIVVNEIECQSPHYIHLGMVWNPLSFQL